MKADDVAFLSALLIVTVAVIVFVRRWYLHAAAEYKRMYPETEPVTITVTVKRKPLSSEQVDRASDTNEDWPLHG